MEKTMPLGSGVAAVLVSHCVSTRHLPRHVARQTQVAVRPAPMDLPRCLAALLLLQAVKCALCASHGASFISHELQEVLPWIKSSCSLSRAPPRIFSPTFFIARKTALCRFDIPNQSVRAYPFSPPPWYGPWREGVKLGTKKKTASGNQPN